MEDEKKTKADKHMKLKELCRAMGSVEAEVIRSFLASNGITSVLGGTMVQSIYPLSVDGLGEIKILVSETDYPLAKKLLEDNPLAEEE
jgi:hypothetical protein